MRQALGTIFTKRVDINPAITSGADFLDHTIVDFRER
jgi:hypothetical protein